MKNSRLVYSTGQGRICPKCSKPSSRCVCAKKKGAGDSGDSPADGVVRIRREVKGRKGKTVTAIQGLALDDKGLRDFAKTLKALCGAGGSVKDGVIVIQGDHVDRLAREIAGRGHTVKRAGG